MNSLARPSMTCFFNDLLSYLSSIFQIFSTLKNILLNPTFSLIYDLHWLLSFHCKSNFWKEQFMFAGFIISFSIPSVTPCRQFRFQTQHSIDFALTKITSNLFGVHSTSHLCNLTLVFLNKTSPHLFSFNNCSLSSPTSLTSPSLSPWLFLLPTPWMLIFLTILSLTSPLSTESESKHVSSALTLCPTFRLTKWITS